LQTDTESKMTKTIQLYCPSNRRTVDGFVISPYQANDQVVQAARLALQIKHADLYTVDGKHITGVELIENEQRVLVAATPNEHMLPDAPSGFLQYNGEEAEDVNPDIDVFGQPWEDLSEQEKREHIESLNEQKPTTREILRITRPWKAVRDDLKALEKAAPQQVATAGGLKDFESHIEQRWGMTYDSFLSNPMKPAKWKVGGMIWDEKVVAALNILSSLTHGQPILAKDFLEESIKMRLDDEMDRSPVVQYQDVANAVTIIYEHANIIPSKVSDTKPYSAVD
jgi:hypothetical protein